MADLIIPIVSKISYYNSKYLERTGISNVSGYSNQIRAAADARVSATQAANSALNNLNTPNPSTGGALDNVTINLGSKYSTNTSIGEAKTYSYSDDAGNQFWRASCSWSASKTLKMNQVKLNFNIPSGLSENMIEQAILKLKYSSNNNTNYEYYIYAPNTSNEEQTQYVRYSENTFIDKNPNNINSFQRGKQTTEQTKSIDITKVFKKCLNTDGWILLSCNDDNESSSRYITITEDPTIEIEYNYTKVGTPTGVQINKAIEKPGGSVIISWDPASNGINNNVSKYKIYYSYNSNIINPTINSTVIETEDTSTSYTFNLPSEAIRANYYTFRVQAVGSIGGASGNGDLSLSVSCRVNSLPEAPIITLATPRIKVNESTVSCTCIPGDDIDTNQTRVVKYNTRDDISSSTVISSEQLAVGTYYFWTYDGLEYSSSYITKTIIQNTLPTIDSVGVIDASNNPFISLTGSEAHSAYIITSYKWYISSDGIEWLEMTGINSLDFSNYDITQEINTWDTTFGFKIRVYDDNGEYNEASTNFSNKTPAIPIYTKYNQINQDSNVSGTNLSHFQNGIRIKFNENNLNSNIEYAVIIDESIQSDYSSITEAKNIPLNKSYGTQVSCYINYKCSNLIGQSAPFTITRALNNTPENITWALNNINVYEATISTLIFNQLLIAFNDNNDIPSSNPQNNYSLKLIKGDRNILLNGSDITSSISNTNGTIEWIISLSSITKSQWKTLLNTNNLPIGNYNLTIQVIMSNNFGDSFIGSEDISLFFGEKALDLSYDLKIKMIDGNYSTIPSNNNQRYSLFENQILQFFIGSFQCYTDNYVKISITDDKGKIAVTSSITPSLVNGQYTILDQSIVLDPLTNIATTEDVTFTITVNSGIIKENNIDVVGPGSEQSILIKNNCKYIRTQLSSTDLNIKGIVKDGNNYTVNYEVTDLGSSGNAPRKDGYRFKQIEIQYCTTADGTYTPIDSAQSLGDETTGSISITNANLPTNFYVGYKITVGNNFEAIGGKIPYGESTYIVSRKYASIYYGDMPTILYGKNFLGINTDTPKNGIISNSEGILTIRPYANHNIIYVGYSGKEGIITLTQSGVEINNFILDGGTWSNQS